MRPLQQLTTAKVGRLATADSDINTHPQEHAIVVQAFRDSVLGTSAPSPASIYLVRFCMRVLKWPEIKAAAEIAYNDGGNALRAHEVEQLLAVYA
ncbi:MAG: hypothetical protein DME50_06420 [Verrucomicrobia bacterium]|nr:MAG: hypothetical protein DME50_06420 [Verrucomicrobiota bacterium]